MPAKIDGSARFAGDVRLPDMVYAAVRSGPPGSRLAGVDRAAADHVPGTLAVLRNPEWAAVAATNWWAAARALNAINPRFHRPDNVASSASISAALAAALDSGGGDRLFETGDVDGAFPGASPINARYEVGLAPSAAIEPLTATARVTGDRLEIWAPTQAPGLARAAAARAVGFRRGPGDALSDARRRRLRPQARDGRDRAGGDHRRRACAARSSSPGRASRRSRTTAAARPPRRG